MVGGGRTVIIWRMAKCYFVSDLHLFANRSNAHRYLAQIAIAASQADVFVLGGDIFDFRWSSLPTARAVGRAAEWLDALLASSPACQFHLVLGNHDYHQVFIDRLVRLSGRPTTWPGTAITSAWAAAFSSTATWPTGRWTPRRWRRPAKNGSTAGSAARSSAGSTTWS